MIEQIRKPVEKEFLLYQKAYKDALHSSNPYLSKIVSYLDGFHGKEIRPTLILLSAALFGEINPLTVKMAVSVELLHTASLIHDDVVDESSKRRSRKTVNAIWDNKVSVLAGDYYLSKVLELMSSFNNTKQVRMLAELGLSLSDGELRQLYASSCLSVDEKLYYEIIERKTARLFSFSMSAGALTVDAHKENIDKMGEFGKYLGMIFQIKDDIFDYDITEKSEKPVGHDLSEGKVTLPLIYALRNADRKDAKFVLGCFAKRNFTPEKVRKIYAFAVRNGGLDYAKAKMSEYKSRALACMDSFPENSIKGSLRLCVDYFMDRTH